MGVKVELLVGVGGRGSHGREVSRVAQVEVPARRRALQGRVQVARAGAFCRGSYYSCNMKRGSEAHGGPNVFFTSNQQLPNPDVTLYASVSWGLYFDILCKSLLLTGHKVNIMMDLKFAE